MNVYLITYFIVFITLFCIAVINLTLFKLENKFVLSKQNTIAYNFKKITYQISQSEITKKFLLNFLVSSFAFVLAFFPLLYYINHSSYNLDYLLSNIHEGDFVFIWISVTTLFLYNDKISSSVTIKNELSQIINVFLSLLILCFVQVRLPELNIQSYDILERSISIILMISLLLVARDLFLNKRSEPTHNVAIKQFEKITFDVYRLSICVISTNYFLRILKLHITQNDFVYMNMALSLALFFILKLESLIWKNTSEKQSLYLSGKYNQKIKFGILILICITFYLF